MHDNEQGGIQRLSGGENASQGNVARSGVDPEAIIRYEDRICPHCENEFKVGITEWMDRTGDGHDGLRNVLRGFTVVCDACADKMSRTNYLSERRAAINDRVRTKIAQGDLSADPRDVAAFATSKADIEARNYTAWDRARAWKYDSHLYVYGPSGTGKTFLCRCLLSKAIDDGYGVAELSARRVVSLPIRHSDGQATWLRWSRAKVLLLDDLDKCDWNMPGSLQAIWDFLDARSKAQNWTFVTSNCDSDAIYRDITKFTVNNKSLAVSLMERLLPISKLEMAGDSLRRQT